MMNLFPGLRITQSKIPEAGLGVFSLSPIRKGTFLGIYKGELKSERPKHGSYAYVIPDFDDLTGETYLGPDRKSIGWIDAMDLAKSNWTRFVNTALTPEKANVDVIYDRYNVQFITNRRIRSEEELLIYYGDDYVNNLLEKLKITK